VEKKTTLEGSQIPEIQAMRWHQRGQRSSPNLEEPGDPTVLTSGVTKQRNSATGKKKS